MPVHGPKASLQQSLRHWDSLQVTPPGAEYLNSSPPSLQKVQSHGTPRSGKARNISVFDKPHFQSLHSFTLTNPWLKKVRVQKVT